MDTTKRFRAARENFRWDDVAKLAYKQEGSAPFKDISRQVLFEEPSLGCQLRYFEMQPRGYSTLERHEHVHAVMILRGHGTCLVGDEVRRVKPRDLITIPRMTWQQFRADEAEAMGFLCMVNQARDKPQLPSADDLDALRRNRRIADFLDAAHHD